MSTVRQIAIVAVALVAAIGLWYAAGGGLPFVGGPTIGGPSRAGGEPPALPVIVAAVQIEENSTVVRAVGSGEALRTVTLYPRSAGEVAEVRFVPGQKVETGDVLIRLDDAEEALAVQLAQVRIRDARQLLQRYERAVRGGGVSASEVDTARTTLEEARIQLAQAELALERRSVVAPFAGVVGFSSVDIGDRASETTAVTTLDDRTAILIDFDVPEAAAGSLVEGGTVAATTWSFPGERFAGAIVAIDSRIDPEARSLRVRARIRNPDDRLRTGMSFGVNLEIPGHPFPSVPEIALQWGREGAYVWVVRDERATQLPVTVRQRTRGRVLAEGDLAEGDMVVMEGVLRLREGARVAATRLEPAEDLPLPPVPAEGS
ncbi:MAG: efflux RND transporter periplasmic adaptor subunit [Alphaproteobacteria bacterium]